MEKLVIVGTGMATARLLESLVAKQYTGVITVIGDEAQPCYNRILLSSLLSGEKQLDDLPLLEPGFYARHSIELINGERVTAIDTSQRQIAVATGRRIAYDRLVLATGSRAHFPAIPGIELSGVMGFRSIRDLELIRQSVSRGDPVVVIGGGLLGLEAAHGLNTLGANVTVVHRRKWLMNRQLDRAAGEVLIDQLRARHIRFSLGASPHAIEGEEGRVRGVRLDNGELLPASMVLFAAGIDPNSELARDAGIHCERGILVDQHLQTAIPGIYALGECCQLGRTTFGLVAPVWEQGAVLAAQLSGDTSASYCYQEAPTQLKVSGIDLFSAGNVDAPGEEQVVRDDASGIYRRLVLDGNRIKAAVLLGDRKDGSWYRELIEQGRDISGIRHGLLFGREFCQAAGDGS